VIEYVSFGIVIDDIVYPDGRVEADVLGGGGPQTAWGMAAALADIHHSSTADRRVGLAASVGVEIGDGIFEPLDAAGIDTSGIKPEWEATPRAWQVINETGGREHRWQVPPPFADAVRPRASLLTKKYRNARGYHWGLHPENPGLELAHRMTRQGKIVSLETFRPPDHPLRDDDLHDLLTACTIFSPNLEEAVGITGEHRRAPMLARFRDCGAQIIALRLGAHGAEIWDFRGGCIEAVMVPAFQTAVVDAVGAGNAFCGAFLVSLSLGLKAAACHAVTAASYLVEQVGIPTMLPARFDYETRLGVVYADTVTTL
jgi:sugar/nucleoside kinase (ribokinase family)